MPEEITQYTLEKLLALLQDLVKKNPDALSWKVNHVEFGGITETYNIDIEENEKRVVIG